MNTSGGVAAGTSGSVSYSVGQVFYNQLADNDFTLHEGVQLPYELFIITPVAIENEQQFDMRVFPNPTNDFLILASDEPLYENLTFHLFDMNGRKLQTGRLLSDNTRIQMISYLPGVYFLVIINENTNEEINKFKIIKNH
jgi:hypothetical protein